jgi:hypothetical protein
MECYHLPLSELSMSYMVVEVDANDDDGVLRFHFNQQHDTHLVYLGDSDTTQVLDEGVRRLKSLAKAISEHCRGVPMHLDGPPKV